MIRGCEEMLLGESWYFEFEVRATDRNAAVIITESSYTLADLNTKDIVASGPCEINGNTIKALITPTEVGVFILTVSATMPPEIIQNRLKLIVLE